MSLMTTYATTEIMGNVRLRTHKIEGVKRSKTIVYPEVLCNRFQFGDAADSNNGIWMLPLAPTGVHKVLFQSPDRESDAKRGISCPYEPKGENGRSTACFGQYFIKSHVQLRGKYS